MRRLSTGSILWLTAKLIVIALLAQSCFAQKKLTVEQLQTEIGDAIARQRADKDTAARIVTVELTERITEDTLAVLQARAPGPQTASVLQELADQSAFLEPPPDAQLQTKRPSADQMRRMFDLATRYALQYASLLPDFICRETIHRFDNVVIPNQHRTRLGALFERDTLVAQLTFANGQETLSVPDNAAQTGLASPKRIGFITTGDFGPILFAPFLPASKATAHWSHWETLHGHPVAVFRYSVASVNSKYQVSYCCQKGKDPVSVNSGVQGFLFLEPETGVILRVTRSSAGLPSTFPTQQVDTEVEYGPVTIGERSYLCPIRSVARADNLAPGSNPAGLRLNALNTTHYSDYRKFAAEGRLVTSIPSNVGSQIKQSTQPPNARTEATAKPEPRDLPETAPDRPPVETASADEISSVLTLPKPPSFDEKRLTLQDLVGAVDVPTFKQKIHIVTLPAVVRDRKGDTVSDLGPLDFELFDNGKKQLISNVLVRHAEDLTHRTANNGTPAQPGPEHQEANERPTRFIAYIFDDIHLASGDLSQIRSAEGRLLVRPLQLDTRIAIFTTSGQNALPFTADRDKLVDALHKLRPNPVTRSGLDCPNIGYYQSDLILNKSDESALSAAIAEAISDCGVNPADQSIARNMALAAARQSLTFHDYETRLTLEALRLIFRQMAVLPGERTAVLISPGFFSSAELPGMNAVVERALRNNVTINALDARGLYTIAGFDASQKKAPGTGLNDYAKREQFEQSAVLVQLADSTGGRIFQNSNDYDAALSSLANGPSVTYVLTFTPDEKTLDGHYHKLKLNVTRRGRFDIYSRRGYIASSQTETPQEEAKEDTESILFSRDEMQQIPLAVTVRLHRKENHTLQIQVSTHVSLRDVGLRIANDQAKGSLTLTFGLFDANGKLTAAYQQDFPLSYTADQLRSLLESGVNIGTQLSTGGEASTLRIVLRDDQGHMSALNESLNRDKG